MNKYRIVKEKGFYFPEYRYVIGFRWSRFNNVSMFGFSGLAGGSEGIALMSESDARGWLKEYIDFKTPMILEICEHKEMRGNESRSDNVCIKCGEEVF